MKIHWKFYLYAKRFKMRFVMLSIVTVLLLVFVWQSETTKPRPKKIMRQGAETTPFEKGHEKVINEFWCWRAKHCHNTGKKICGMDKRRNKRSLFKNACTMYKHNCERNDDYSMSNWKECTIKRKSNINIKRKN